jgi:cyclophilin family peptidyl-prolyl cis-trans isomerase
MIYLNKYRYFPLFLILFCVIMAYAPNQNPEEIPSPPVKIKLTTNYGDMVLQLYDETPLHRDNFIKLVKEGVLDSLLFHRVIDHFMIQAGDTESKNASAEDTLGGSDLPYTIPAEIKPNLFHKKGALAAARGDTPERESSSSQFYIVQGKVLNDSLLDIAEKRINGWLAEYYIKHDPIYNVQLDSLNRALDKEDWESFIRINDRFRKLAKDYHNFEIYQIPSVHREIYNALGGTPHLDQNYTVFGEVISGLEVVDSIAAVQTNDMDRPIKDVRILSAQIIDK